MSSWNGFKSRDLCRRPEDFFDIFEVIQPHFWLNDFQDLFCSFDFNKTPFTADLYLDNISFNTIDERHQWLSDDVSYYDFMFEDIPNWKKSRQPFYFNNHFQMCLVSDDL